MSTAHAIPTPTRWLDAAWQREILAWVDARLADRGAIRTGWTQLHLRPWSTVLRVDTDSLGAVWVKANGDGTRYEASLLALLTDLGIPGTPRPWSVDESRGWTLLPDGGPTSREAHGGRTPPERMAQILDAYAVLQRASEPHVARFLAVGVDDLSPRRMPKALRDLLDTAVDAGDARLRSLLPAYEAACAELGSTDIAPTLQHDDLHDNNVFDRDTVVFDWGDAVVGHPFGTLVAALRSVAHHQEVRYDDPLLVRLADGYTEHWTDVADRATLRRQAGLAIRVGGLSRAKAWARALMGADVAAQQEWGDSVAGWLGEIDAEDLPLRPPRLT